MVKGMTLSNNINTNDVQWQFCDLPFASSKENCRRLQRQLHLPIGSGWRLCEECLFQTQRQGKYVELVGNYMAKYVLCVVIESYSINSVVAENPKVC